MKKLSLFVLPALFALGCGGDVLDDLLKDAGNGPCAPGVTPYQIKTGIYNTTSVTAIVDTCNTPPLTAAELTKQREVANDAQGNITLFTVGTVGTTKTALGIGPISCNKGNLVNTLTVNDGIGCRFTSTNALAVTVTAPNQLSVAFTSALTNWMQDPNIATKCIPPTGGSCSTAYTAALFQ